ncbi:MAG: zinc-ribbon domain-containing protein [Oscillospiraceae bacterium]|nr:zinc-ribbon domain-containing protein [Oscillospiraceae bacterium]
MGLIMCEKCGSRISDKATQCPNCGEKFNVKPPEPVEKVVCTDCGFEYTAGKPACPQCGCPNEHAAEVPQRVEVTGVSVGQVNKKTVITVVVIFILAVAGIVAGVTISNSIKEKKEAAEAAAEAARIEAENFQRVDKFKSDAKQVSLLMLEGAAEAEDAGGLIHDVWYNTIYEKSSYKTDKYTKGSWGGFYSDFNTSLGELFSSSDFKKQKLSIETNQKEVQDIMKGLTNPPDECREMYDAVKDMYEAYTKFTNLVISPTGSLSSYTSEFNSLDSEVLNCYNNVKLYVD